MDKLTFKEAFDLFTPINAFTVSDWDDAMTNWESYYTDMVSASGLPIERWLKNAGGYFPDFFDTKEIRFGHARIGNYDHVMIYLFTGKDSARFNKYIDKYNGRTDISNIDDIRDNYRDHIQSLLKQIANAKTLSEVYALEESAEYTRFSCKTILRKITVMRSLMGDPTCMYNHAFMWFYSDTTPAKLAKLLGIKRDTDETFLRFNNKIYEVAKDYAGITASSTKEDYIKLYYFLLSLVGDDEKKITDTEESGDSDDADVDSSSSKFSKNIILYGPPGTGKTYSSVCYSVAIIDNQPIEAIQKEDYPAVFARYTDYKKNGLIAFVTFHQSYGYEEFIEGIKPKTDDSGNITYNIEPGVFKKFCENCPAASDDTDKFTAAWTKFVAAAEKGGNKITIPMAKKNRNLDWDSVRERFYIADFSSSSIFVDADMVRDTYFNQATWTKGGSGGAKRYTAEGILKKLESDYGLTPPSHELTKKNRVFIIDEINRGNISKIFGELITLLEDTKRLGAKEAQSALLPHSQTLFGIPDNVYLLGTMNTADRSIAALDTALRRRFSFVEMMPNSEILKDVEIDGVNIESLLNKINQRITALFDREHTIGHAYFTKLKSGNPIECLADIFQNKVIPLLQEYFYEDYEKIRLVLADNQVPDIDTAKQFVLKENVAVASLFGSSDVDMIDEATIYKINTEAFKNPDAYTKIYQ